MATYVEVVDAGPGWTQVRDENGNVLTVKGDRNWRNNNPGNIEYGDFTKSHGAIGSDGRFAVFPDYETGRAAKESLLFDSPSYSSKTIAGAISRYAPSFENNTSAYINAVAGALGIPADTPLSSLSASQRSAMLDAMQQVEGFRRGSVYAADGKKLPGASAPVMLGYSGQPRQTPAQAAIDAATGAPVMRPKAGGGILGNAWSALTGGLGNAVQVAGAKARPLMRSASSIDPRAEIMKRVNPVEIALYMLGNHATPIMGAGGPMNPITQQSEAWQRATGTKSLMRAASAPALYGASGVRGQDGPRNFNDRNSDGVPLSAMER